LFWRTTSRTPSMASGTKNPSTARRCSSVRGNARGRNASRWEAMYCATAAGVAASAPVLTVALPLYPSTLLSRQIG
jgi:hypothetical protein